MIQLPGALEASARSSTPEREINAEEFPVLLIRSTQGGSERVRVTLISKGRRCRVK